MIFNEEGKIYHKCKPSLIIKLSGGEILDTINGDVVFCRIVDDKIISLTDREVETVKARLVIESLSFRSIDPITGRPDRLTTLTL